MYSADTEVTVNGITLRGHQVRGQRKVLTIEALEFLAHLHRTFEPRRRELLADREEVKARISEGWTPDFPEETRAIREDDTWKVAPLAPGLNYRQVEITGPVDRKMTVNALNSGALGWMADFEDSSTPAWENVVCGQINMRDAIRRQIDFRTEAGKRYRLDPEPEERIPTINVRPRGLHLMEDHLLIDGEPIAGALMDFGLYFFHNAQELIARGRGPYFYLPKLEHYREARWWNEVFCAAQDYLGLERGTIRATVLIETITAAFQMEEILYELREHAAGLNAGRWDYIFSIIKMFRDRGAQYVLPDRVQVTMTAPMMRAYTEQLVRACHRRGASAIGGMAAQIPNRRDPQANTAALEKVHADKLREATDGFDGSWVAHPDLVPIAREAFDEVLGGCPHQIRTRTRQDVVPDAEGLLNVGATEGEITEAGIRTNIDVGIRYMDSWLRGSGAAAIHGLMEDAATAEISRSQIWQWIDAGAQARMSDDGTMRRVTRRWVEELVDDVFSQLPRSAGDRFDEARELFVASALAKEFPAFLTVPAYEQCLSAVSQAPSQQEAPEQVGGRRPQGSSAGSRGGEMAA
ncbi:malate synthase A [Nesterenkonia aerolata]|uniref:Malate synthase n=1 Tax=Nesterenkonia aerolata TaxID=3074079 RepID=A0ABU2DP44_9MICC|nr:malate synthase A [Nesterenkonia sp. LY-0111]MDR8018275.1 malate synthase A [Nesterenkonia sp. LY-0111]